MDIIIINYQYTSTYWYPYYWSNGSFFNFTHPTLLWVLEMSVPGSGTCGSCNFRLGPYCCILFWGVTLPSWKLTCPFHFGAWEDDFLFPFMATLRKNPGLKVKLLVGPTCGIPRSTQRGELREYGDHLRCATHLGGRCFLLPDTHWSHCFFCCPILVSCNHWLCESDQCHKISETATPKATQSAEVGEKRVNIT